MSGSKVNPFLDSLKSGFDALPAELIERGRLGLVRRAAMASVLRDGLPTARSERWKYTSLRAFERRGFALLDPTAGESVETGSQALNNSQALSDIPAPRMVFVNGRFAARLSQLDGLPEGVELSPLSALLAEEASATPAHLTRRFDVADEAFSRLNAALATEGVVLTLEAGLQLQAPLHLVYVGTPAEADQAWHLRSLIALSANARVSVVEHYLAVGEHRHLSNVLTHIELGEGAVLSHARVQDESAGASLFQRSEVEQAAKSTYRRLDLELGGALSRHELNVNLAGKGAAVHANGVLLADRKRHVDTRLGIRHTSGDTRCDLVWRGLGAASGRAVFHGGILIGKGADGSNASLSNKNLLLSADAEIDTQPVLEIHADEVQAAHGATVGQLDPAAMFYLRSRGLPEEEARRLLTVAFCREPINAIVDSALAAVLSAQLDRRLHAAGAL